MQPKRNLWPFALVTAFVIFISGTAGLIVLAASQKSDLIDENYYEQEIRYQSRIDSLERANKLIVPATVKYDHANSRIEIALPADHAKSTGHIDLYRPSGAELDHDIALAVDEHGFQFLDASKLQTGLWRIRVTWIVAGEEYVVDQKIVIKKS